METRKYGDRVSSVLSVLAFNLPQELILEGVGVWFHNILLMGNAGLCLRDSKM